MGLFSQKEPKQAPTGEFTRNPDTTSTQPTTPADPTAATQSIPLSRDDVADAEFAKLLTQLDAEHRASSAAEQQAVSGRGSAFREEAKETVYPTEISCITAFDELFYCYSLGGQMTNVYRYGTWRDCSQKGKNFRFCMKTKMYGPAARRKMILEHFKEQEARFKTGPSSEDVWTIRKTPLIERAVIEGKDDI